MFFPLEPAFYAGNSEGRIALDGRVSERCSLGRADYSVIVVRIVENLWRQEQQAKNVQKVMDRGEKLYDKFVGFAEDLEKVGDRISEADLSYKEALVS